MKQKKTYYYNTLEDEVEHDNIVPPKIDKNYNYTQKNIFSKFWAWFYYRIIIFPIGWLYCKFKGFKYIGAKKIRKCKTGFFMYGNHTNKFSDVFSPSMLSPNKKPYLIVNPKNLNVPILHSSTKYLGAMPLPDGLEAHKNFLNAIEYRLKQKHGIIIYPEAKLWPYYTKIRPYDDQSFRYPVKFNVPTFCITTTYQTTKRGKCKTIIYVDGPYYPKPELTFKQNQQELHKIVFDTMINRSKLSNFNKCNYQQIKEKNDD